MDNKIAKNYFLEKNYYLENFHKILNATIESLYQNYVFLRIIPYCNFDDEDDEDLKKMYKYLLEMNAILQKETLSYLCIFIAFKDLDKEFTTIILNNAVTSNDPDLIQLIQVIKDTLNNDDANMQGGANFGSLLSKLIILLLLFANLSIQTKGIQTRGAIDFDDDELVVEVINEDDYHTTEPRVKKFTIKENINTNVNTIGSQKNTEVSIFGHTPITSVPRSFKQDQEQRIKKEKKKMIAEAPIMGQVNALMLREKTDKELLEEFNDAVYDLKQEFISTYDTTSKNCKSLITATKRVGYLNPTKFKKTNSTSIIDDDEDVETNETTSSFSSYLNPYAYFYPSSPTKKDNETNITNVNDTTSMNEENSKTYGLISINTENTNKLALYQAQEKIEQEAIYYCELVFRPEMLISQDFENLVIQKGISGYLRLQNNDDDNANDYDNENAENIPNNALTPFDKFRPNLIAIKDKIKEHLKSDKYPENSKKYAKLQDISEKTQILLEIIENSKNAVYYFGNEVQFKNKIDELKQAKQQIAELNALFEKSNPVTYREGVLAKQKEAEFLKQKSEQEQILHEGELQVGKEEFGRREENLDLAKNQTDIARQEASNFVRGTLGVVTSGLEEGVENVGDVGEKVGEQTTKIIKSASGGLWELLYILGAGLGVAAGGLSLYAFYGYFNARMAVSKVTSTLVPTGNATSGAQNTPQGQQVAPEGQPNAPQGQPNAPQQQILIADFGNNNGVITKIDMQQNNQFVAFYNLVYSNEDNAVRFENIKIFYNNPNNADKIIFYIDPPQFNFKCGKFQGVLNEQILIDLPNGSVISKPYKEIIDPTFNNYQQLYQEKIQACLEQFTAKDKYVYEKMKEHLQKVQSPVLSAVSTYPSASVSASVSASAPPVEDDNNSETTISQQVNDYNEDFNKYQGESDDEDSVSTVSQDVDERRGSRGGKTKNNRKNHRKRKTVKKHKQGKNKTIKNPKKHHRKTYKNKK